MKKLKRPVSVIMVLLLTFSALPMSGFLASADANDDFIYQIGEAEPSAIEISSAEELAAISSDMYGSYVLTRDIDLSGYGDWTPIGYLKASPFRGTLDGQGHSIIGLTVKSSIDSSGLRFPPHGVGLFGICEGATIKNLALKNVSVSVETTSGYVYKNVEIDGRNVFAGAVAGYVYNNSVIHNTYATGIVSSNASSEAEGATSGGLVGLADSAIFSYSYNKCDVTAKADNMMYSTSANAGGIVGLSRGAGYISACYNTGSVTSITTGFGESDAGGLIGKSESKDFSVSDSFNEGEVSGNAGDFFCDDPANAGGIAGNYCGTVGRTYNAGTVSAHATSYLGDDKAYAGGICGFASDDSSITNNASVSSDVKAEASANASARISNGGLKSDNISTSSYASGAVQDADYTYEPEALKTESPYASLGWDFSGVWTFVSGKDYPQLKKITESDPLYEGEYINQHLDFIENGGYSDMLANQRWANVYWSEEYCGKDNQFYNFVDAFSDLARFKFGDLFNTQNLFKVILAGYIADQGMADCVIDEAEETTLSEVENIYHKAKSFIGKYWDDSKWGDLSDEDIFYLFHYDSRPSEEWVNGNFPEALEEIVSDTKNKNEWFTETLKLGDGAIEGIFKIKDKYDAFTDFISDCAKTSASVEAFITSSAEFKIVLQTMNDNIGEDILGELRDQFGFDVNFKTVSDLKSALSDYSDFMFQDENAMRAELWERFIENGIIDKAKENIKSYFLDKTANWIKLRLSAFPYLLNILESLGWMAEGGAKLIDFLTNEADLQEYRGLLQANSIFEHVTHKALESIKTRFTGNPDFSNAKIFDAAFSFFKETEIYSMNVMMKYLDAYQKGYLTALKNMSNSTKATEIEEILINRRALYNTHCHGLKFSLGGKIITVACPTDVSVFNESGSEVVSIKNNVVSCGDDAIDVFVTNDVKYIVLPLGYSFSLKITSTGNGLMEYSVAEYDESVKNVQTAIYTDVKLNNGDVFTGNVSGDLYERQDAYNLHNNGEEIKPDFVANQDNGFVPPSELNILDDNVKLEKGENFTINYAVNPKNASVDAVLWTTSDANVAEVSETGLITAINPGTAVISGYTFCGGVTDSVAVEVTEKSNNLSILTDKLPDGIVNSPYNSGNLKATEENVTWKVSGGGLPNGLTLSESGVITGTPTSEGLFKFIVSATDGSGAAAQKELTINIAKEQAPADKPESSGKACKFCGRTHEGFFGKIVWVLHMILYFFARLFGIM